MPWFVAAGVLVAGSLAAVHYSAVGLSLSHYDARAHLVVARRILDSMTPGWQQIGAVWLPLPHVLNMLPVQVDAWYRTGASAIAISVASMAAAAWALATIVLRLTGSAVAGVAGAALMIGNPNVLYLQSAPMTEPLLAATCLLAITFTADWVDRGAAAPPRAAGWAIVATCMTRYEAWPICASLIGLAGAVLLRRGVPAAHALRACGRLATYPAVAIALFSANSRWTTGAWFVSSDFYVPENEALGSATRALEQVGSSVQALSSPVLVWAACAAAIVLALSFIRSQERASLVLLLAIAAAAVLPAFAYYQGHPLRVRYGLPLVIACASVIAGGIGTLWAPIRRVAAAVIVAFALIQAPPLDPEALLVLESRLDEANRKGRRVVTGYLRKHWDGTPVMMSMGSLAHYMHDLTELDMHIRHFLHEGNENLWLYAARLGPRSLVRWVVVEERAEGGDSLFQAAQGNPAFFDGFDRVAEGGGVALYRARE